MRMCTLTIHDNYNELHYDELLADLQCNNYPVHHCEDFKINLA